MTWSQLKTLLNNSTVLSTGRDTFAFGPMRVPAKGAGK
ncbi:hypothetical protein SAMN05216197_16810 [Pseudomonas graminis]|uniref:Uncharacterized protein n=1 Tax=Pseudomonas graminis TaxID=158627 RepID=A0A1I0JNK1_9PSED|nr:hypothetical protein SAMN05216197_16810 [Pseudomonas graminis]